MKTRYTPIVNLTFVLLFIILFFYVVTAAKHFLSPLVLAAIFSYLLYPLVTFLEKHRFNRILANLISIILLITVLSIAIHLIIRNLDGLIQNLPNLRAQAHANIDEMAAFIERNFDVSIQEQKQLIKDGITNLFRGGSDFSKSFFSATTSTIFQLGILPVFIFYLLYYREKLFDFIMMITPKKRIKVIDKIIKEISYVTPRYIGGIFTVVIILAILNSIGLYIVGLEYALLFGIISAIFNFIPYFGNWIGASIPLTFALLTGDSLHLVLGVFILFLIIQFLENNILTPNITGRYVNLNPLFTIFIIIIGGLIWGIVGMFVVIPLMATVKIVFDNFKSLKPYAFLIGTNQSKKGMKWIIKLRSALNVKK
ncbi:MAG: AI-2E family transporter [Bacteroidetes bacterium]|nr:AI-2E family transporter [Bacteroidota bacterium]